MVSVARTTFIFVLILYAFTMKAQIANPFYSLFLKGFLSHSVQLVGVDTAEKMLDEAIILDARQKKEYEVSHLKNARWVGYDEFNKEAVDELPRDKPVIIYCSVGYRSEKIGEKLKEMGFQNIYNLHGGIFEWVNQGKPVYHEGRPTDKIHAYSRTWGVWVSKGDKVYD